MLYYPLHLPYLRDGFWMLYYVLHLPYLGAGLGAILLVTLSSILSKASPNEPLLLNFCIFSSTCSLISYNCHTARHQTKREG